MNFTEQDLKNVAALIAKSPITGADASTVAVLQQKIANAIACFHTPPSVQPGDQPPDAGPV